MLRTVYKSQQQNLQRHSFSLLDLLFVLGALSVIRAINYSPWRTVEANDQSSELVICYTQNPCLSCDILIAPHTLYYTTKWYRSTTSVPVSLLHFACSVDYRLHEVPTSMLILSRIFRSFEYAWNNSNASLLSVDINVLIIDCKTEIYYLLRLLTRFALSRKWLRQWIRRFYSISL